MIQIRCTGAWVKGVNVRKSCRWSIKVDDLARPGHLTKTGGLPPNRWTSCPQCGGSITFNHIGWLHRRVLAVADSARHFAALCGK